MQDLPSAAELVEAVREFLESDIFPAVDGRAQFHTRVAMNVLAIVKRELEQSADADARERAGLEALLGRATGDESLVELNQELGSRIRAGTLDATREALVAHLKATARDKLAIANPKHLEG